MSAFHGLHQIHKGRGDTAVAPSDSAPYQTLGEGSCRMAPRADSNLAFGTPSYLRGELDPTAVACRQLHGNRGMQRNCACPPPMLVQGPTSQGKEPRESALQKPKAEASGEWGTHRRSWAHATPLARLSERRQQRSWPGRRTDTPCHRGRHTRRSGSCAGRAAD